MKVGLFFGSFNPIHVGHLIIANMAYENTNLDEVWFVVSPQNPFKRNTNLLHEFDRIDLVRAAIDEHFHFRCSDVELAMPKPSYTIDTLTVLSEKYPNHSFSLIIGADNLASLPRWKNYKRILDYYRLIVYPRPHTKQIGLTDHANVEMIEAPQMEISATSIRKMIKMGKSVKYLVPDKAIALIRSRGYFTD